MKKIPFRFLWCFTLLSFGVFASGGVFANSGGISGLGTPAIFDDNPSVGVLASAESLDLAESQLQKTQAIAFTTGNDITTRQIIFEQGGGTRGFNMVVEAGQLHLNAWSTAGSSYGSLYEWGFKTIAVNIAPQTDYSAMLVLAGLADFTGTFTGYLDGVQVGQVGGIGPLMVHNNGIGVGLNNIYTRMGGDVIDTPSAFLGTVKRLAQFNKTANAEQSTALNTLMTSVHAGQSPSYHIETPVLFLDAPATGNIPNSVDINDGPSYMAKTLAIHFTTSSDIGSRQVLFEQGGGWKGLNMYIENQQLHMNVYSVDGGEELWGYKTVSVDVAANTEYHATLVMQSQQDWSGALTGYINGIEHGVVGGIGPLLKHENGIGVGDINSEAILANVVVTTSHPFTGSLKQVAEFNQALTADEVALLSNSSFDSSTPAVIEVDIISPQTLATVGYSPITVTGLVTGDISVLTLNGVPVTPAGDGSFSAAVALAEGFNTIVARVTNDEGTQVTDSISISLDLTPPYLTIDSHSADQIVYTDTVTVTGLVNDIVRGTVEELQAIVDVNGVTAAVSNRSYAAKNVSLVEGNNLLTITAVDQAGNTTSITQNVIYQVPGARNITVVAGQDQTATIGAKTAEFLQVLVSDENGAPVAGETVVFRVIQGAGVVGAESENYGRAVVATTNAQGVAQTLFQLGYRTGLPHWGSQS